MLGLDLGALLGGAFITETLFGLPGIGQMAVQAIGTQDFPEVMGVTILGALSWPSIRGRLVYEFLPE
jgi:peptide/nickel transport system permease protein